MKMSTVNNARALVTLLDARDRLAQHRIDEVLPPDEQAALNDAIEVLDDAIVELVREIKKAGTPADA